MNSENSNQSNQPERPTRSEQSEQSEQSDQDDRRFIQDTDDEEARRSDHVSDEEDLFENMEQDYVPIPELDHYEEEHLDDQSVSEMSIGERIAAEATLKERDRIEGRRTQIRRGLEAFDMLSDTDSQASYRRSRRKRRFADGLGGMDVEMETETIDNIEDTRGMTIKEWLSQRSTKNEIRNRFKDLLKTYVDESGRSVFKEKLRTMTELNHQSFELEYTILAQEQPALAMFLVEAPNELLDIFNPAAKEVVLSMYPAYERIASDIYVKIRDLALTEEIRSIRQYHLNQLIRVQGVVNSATTILPQLGLVKLDCLKCSYTLGPFVQQQDTEINPGTCPGCQSTGPFTINMEDTIFQNYQRVTIQESPGKISAGRVPRAKDVILLKDLCDSCKPGDEIDLTGIYTNTYDGALNVATGFPVFSTVIMANNIIKRQDWTNISQQLSDSDVHQIVNLSKDPNIVERIIASICPSIYGHENVKRALALSLFGGCPKNLGNKHKVRGDINVLLCGDPGSAKSQFLKYTSKIAPRAVYTTGQGASAVGLTAYVQKSPVTREWTLEAGALVLADKGVCLIDEFDKMSDQDRTSIHEAMEQQSISVSKAGIVASLQARCAVIAAANPIGGRYNSSKTFLNNVELTEPIISRFDVICIIKDEVDPIADACLASFVVRSHIKSHHETDDKTIAAIEEKNAQDKAEQYELIDQDLLRRYIVYSRERFHPKISMQQEEFISKVYADLRRESHAHNSIPITARYIESIIRCSEAYAKMHLRNHVTMDDVRLAVRMTIQSFVATQTKANRRTMEQIFSHQLNYNRSSTEILLTILKNMVIENQKYLQHKLGSGQQIDYIDIDEREFRNRCRRVDDCDPTYFYKMTMFKNNHFTYDEKNRKIRYTQILN